jgi:hypothetical protein
MMPSNPGPIQNSPRDLSVYLKRYMQISCAVLAAATTPMLSKVLSLSPPGAPDNIEVLSIVISIPIIIGCYMLSQCLSKRASTFLLATSLAALLVTTLVYLTWFSEKTMTITTADPKLANVTGNILNPTIDKSIVIGKRCTREARMLHPRECENPLLIKLNKQIVDEFSPGGLPGSLWESEGVHQNVKQLTSLWLAISCLVTLVISLAVNVAPVSKSGQ